MYRRLFLWAINHGDTVIIQVSVMDFLMQAIERAVADVEARRRENEMRRQQTSEIRARLHALVERTSPREGEPYKFNRADAYPEGVFA